MINDGENLISLLLIATSRLRRSSRVPKIISTPPPQQQPLNTTKRPSTTSCGDTVLTKQQEGRPNISNKIKLIESHSKQSLNISNSVRGLIRLLIIDTFLLYRVFSWKFSFGSKFFFCQMLTFFIRLFRQIKRPFWIPQTIIKDLAIGLDDSISAAKEFRF